MIDMFARLAFVIACCLIVGIAALAGDRGVHRDSSNAQWGGNLGGNSISDSSDSLVTVTDDLQCTSDEIKLTYAGEAQIEIINSNLTGDPTFRFGRIVDGGAAGYKMRIVYYDGSGDVPGYGGGGGGGDAEVSIFETEGSGTMAAIRRTSGSYIEGFREGHTNPEFRLNTYGGVGGAFTQLEMGANDSDAAVDVALRRTGAATFIIAEPTTATRGNLGVNVVYHGAGAVGTPTVTFSDDADTGLYYVGADNMGVAVGGVQGLDLIEASSAVKVSVSSGGLVPKFETGDPCAGSGYAEGAIFYNDTANVLCFCDGSNDLKVSDGSACF